MVIVSLSKVIAVSEMRERFSTSNHVQPTTTETTMPDQQNFSLSTKCRQHFESGGPIDVGESLIDRVQDSPHPSNHSIQK